MENKDDTSFKAFLKWVFKVVFYICKYILLLWIIIVCIAVLYQV